MKHQLLTTLLLLILPLHLQATDSRSASQARSIDKHTIKNEYGMTFQKIPAGEFIMGSEDLEGIIIEQPDGKAAMVKDETPSHRVVFKHPFYLATTEVTQQQWLTLMNTKPGPESGWAHKDWQHLPVVSVNWHDTQAFIKKLNAKDAHYQYRLPTEAEWEYAARAGTNGIRPWPVDALVNHAWTIENSGDDIHPVATRKANAWGLHDLFGNVWEWTGDWYAPDSYSNDPLVSPSGPATGTKKVRRGGSFHCGVHLVRPAYRSADTPDTRYSVIGFRLVADPG